jgi:poly-gamma-glutamate synthesis protein (capsule biosynthesis protein)
MKWQYTIVFFTMVVAFMLVSACDITRPTESFSPSITWTPTFTPFQPPSSTPQPATSEHVLTTPTASETPVERALSIWVDPKLPSALRDTVEVPPDFFSTQDPEGAALRLEVGEEAPLGYWVYALVAPFPTQIQGVTSAELHNFWSGESSGPFEGEPLLMDESTRAAFTKLWGEPASGVSKVLSGKGLLDATWRSRPSWAIVPFEDLVPRWKVLEVDGQSSLRKGFDPAVYLLTVPLSVTGEPVLAGLVRTLYGEDSATPLIPASNRDPDKLTTLAMTGVTALVRSTAYTMEQRGITYPGRDVGDWLREADITHISNEVPFAEDCPFPNPVQQDLQFCSDPRYIGLLEDIGTDIVELTGDHFRDWGAEAMYLTLKLYDERGWPYYGGGANIEEGRRAVTLEHNGNKLAFIGCNGKGGWYATAGADHPGAVSCDFDWMQSEIERLRLEGYLPIATFQHFEYYSYLAQPKQIRDFQRVADAGAVIVSGSQAHHPQAIEFKNDAFIHYGLGNLFFDQYAISLATRQAFIDRHVFYDGRYIGTELLPILFMDYARARPMTPEERDVLLRSVFSASDW